MYSVVAQEVLPEQLVNAIDQNDIESFKEIRCQSLCGELLVYALERCRSEIALHLINCNINIKSVNDDETNCLMLAARFNLEACVQSLLDTNEFDIDASDSFGWTALMYSCYYGYSNITKILLLAGAKSDLYDNDQMTSLIWSAGRGHYECVNKLISLGSAKVDLADKSETTPLVWACRKGHNQVVILLLKAGANVDSMGMLGLSPLLAAVSNNQLETAKLLLQQKINVNTCDIHRYTPLITACKEKNIEMVKLLLKAKAFVNLSDEHGCSALIHASKNNSVEIVDLLLKSHAHVDHTGFDKKTALFWAVEKGNTQVIKQLLQAEPNLELVSKDGDTCLLKAIKLKRTEIAKLLLASQAKATAVDKNGDSSLHLAVKYQLSSLIDLILSNPKNHFLIHKQNKLKQSPLDTDVFQLILNASTSKDQSSNWLNSSRLSGLNINSPKNRASDCTLSSKMFVRVTSSPLMKMLSDVFSGTTRVCKNQPTAQIQTQIPTIA